MAALMIQAIKYGSPEDRVSVLCQLGFARAAKFGMSGFFEYETSRRRLTEHLRKPRGRKPSEEVTVALKLDSEGVSRKDIYRQLGKTTPPEKHALREAMRQRKFRQKRTQSSLEQ